MNNARRKTINALYKELNDIGSRYATLKDEAETLHAAIEAVRDEEQEAFDGMPEGLQASDRGQASEQAISNLDSALDTLAELSEADIDFEQALSNLDDAQAN